MPRPVTLAVGTGESMDFKVHSFNVPPSEIITTFYEETSFQPSDHCLLVQVPKALGSLI